MIQTNSLDKDFVEKTKELISKLNKNKTRNEKIKRKRKSLKKEMLKQKVAEIKSEENRELDLYSDFNRLHLLLDIKQMIDERIPFKSIVGEFTSNSDVNGSDLLSLFCLSFSSRSTRSASHEV